MSHLLTPGLWTRIGSHCASLEDAYNLTATCRCAHCGRMDPSLPAMWLLHRRGPQSALVAAVARTSSMAPAWRLAVVKTILRLCGGVFYPVAQSALFMASMQGDVPVMEALLDAGVCPNQRDIVFPTMTPLARAAHEGHAEAVGLLLARGADPHAQVSDGATALILASERGCADSIHALIAAGADPSICRDDGASPLQAAAYFGHTQAVARLLAAGAPPTQQSLFCAAAEGHADVTRLLVPAMLRSQISTPAAEAAVARSNARAEVAEVLREAAARGKDGALRALLEAAAGEVDPDAATEEEGTTALMAAAQEGHEATVAALLAVGANPECRSTAEGVTSLIIASQNGHSGVVRRLLEAGALVDGEMGNGSTALMPAACNGHSDVVEALLAAGANVRAVSADGWSPLLWAAQSGHPRIVEQMLAAGVNPNATQHPDATTPLIAAAHGGHAEVVSLLLAAGARPDLAKSYGVTALQMAALEGQDEAVARLLAAGADPNVQDSEGWTALMAGAMHGRADAVRALIAGGARLDLVNEDGDTARDIAEAHEEDLVVAVLEVAASKSCNRGADVS